MPVLDLKSHSEICQASQKLFQGRSTFDSYTRVCGILAVASVGSDAEQEKMKGVGICPHSRRHWHQ
jgi:hypothetical protein